MGTAEFSEKRLQQLPSKKMQKWEHQVLSLIGVWVWWGAGVVCVCGCVCVCMMGTRWEGAEMLPESTKLCMATISAGIPFPICLVRPELRSSLSWGLNGILSWWFSILVAQANQSWELWKHPDTWAHPRDSHSFGFGLGPDPGIFTSSVRDSSVWSGKPLSKLVRATSPGRQLHKQQQVA